jgi:hypothetical protein
MNDARAWLVLQTDALVTERTQADPDRFAPSGTALPRIGMNSTQRRNVSRTGA